MATVHVDDPNQVRMPGDKKRWILRSASLAVALVVAGPAATVPAHEIPSDITIRVLAKPEGSRLRIVLRVPLKAMRDVNFPLEGPGYLNLDRVQQYLDEAATTWIGNSIRVFEGSLEASLDSIVATRVSIPSDRSFAAFDTAVRHVMAPSLPSTTQLHWQNAMLDVLLDYHIESDRSRFSLDPNLERLALRVLTVLQFESADGASTRIFQYVGDPGLVRLDPSWFQAALTFAKSGFDHILDGIDHLLFLLCLVIPFRRIRTLVPIVTAFTVGHSITLIGSALGLAPNALWFPALVEVLIAASIVYMALENIVGARVERRWMIAFGFGLVHGFGFSFALRESLQFAGSHLLTSLLSFNLGVELGQLLMVVIFVPALVMLFRFGMKERMGTIILSALIAHTAWHWMSDRGQVLMQYRFAWPTTSDVVITAGQWISLLGIIAAGAWLLVVIYRTYNKAPILRGRNETTAPPTNEAS